jgi:hypothetical protein
MNLKNIIALAVMICLSSTPVLAKKEKDKNKALPQGLQMKLDRGGSLSEGMLTVRVEGKLIKLIEATREIVEILDLLNQS